MRKMYLPPFSTACLAVATLFSLSCDQMPADASLTITSPKNGDRWTINEPNGAQIAWDNSGVTGSVILSLIDNNDSLITVINDTLDANAHYHYWTVPPEISPGTKYHVLITSSRNPSITAVSGSVRIEGSTALVQSLEITYPGNNDEWQVGKSDGAQIRWDYGLPTGVASLSLYRSGNPLLQIADSVNIANGLCLWTVPDTVEIGNDYTVQIQSVSDSSVYDFSRRFRIVELDTTQYLDLLEPDGQTTWQVLETGGALIRWDANKVDGALRIDLYRQSDFLMTITDSVDVDNGTFTWTVPETAEDGNGYQVYLESKADPTIHVMSSRFRINPFENVDTIEIVTPSGGDRWTAGEVNGSLIEWVSSGLTGTVHLDLYQDDSFFMDIADDVDVMQGYFTWTVPQYVAGGSGFEVFIESNEDTFINAYSSSFRIDPSDLPSILEVTSPKSGNKWEVLEQDGAVIEWTSENVYDSLSIDLYRDGDFMVHIENSVRVLDHMYTWTVPLNIPAGRGYQVYIESHLLPLVNSFSSNFTIEPSEISPSIEVATPKGWVVGEADGALIEWEQQNLSGSVKIRLFKEDQFLMDIADDVSVDSLHYTWTVPNTVAAGRNFQVYIESHVYPLINTFSADFRISDP